MKVFQRPKTKFSKQLLFPIGAKICMVDVGSGGLLKYPWCLLDQSVLQMFGIEPTDPNVSRPLCLSNRIGHGKLYVAKDQRASSLHQPEKLFVKRFEQNSLQTTKVLKVELSTLDNLLLNRMDCIDAIDINAEGHDFQILQGGEKVLQNGTIKLIKVEFELTAVWRKQGWFSDIDDFCRQQGFDLVKLEIDAVRPAHVRHLFHPGEPLWGKAYYVPSLKKWQELLKNVSGKEYEHAIKAVVLTTLADIPGRALDFLDSTKGISRKDKEWIQEEICRALRYNVLEEAKNDAIRFLQIPLRIAKHILSGIR